jgi:hypothetical protein
MLWYPKPWAELHIYVPRPRVYGHMLIRPRVTQILRANGRLYNTVIYIFKRPRVGAKPRPDPPATYYIMRIQII